MALPDAWAYSRVDLMRRLLPLLQSASQEDLYRLCRQLEGQSRQPRTEESRRLRRRIGQWTGIPVAIGIGHTKVQAKLANHLAKKCPGAEGVFDLTAQAAPDPWLVRMPVADQGSTETSASP